MYSSGAAASGHPNVRHVTWHKLTSVSLHQLLSLDTYYADMRMKLAIIVLTQQNVPFTCIVATA